jgi:hypothetical protein
MVVSTVVLQQLPSDAFLGLPYNEQLDKGEGFYILFLQELANLVIDVDYHQRVGQFEPYCHEF